MWIFSNEVRLIRNRSRFFAYELRKCLKVILLTENESFNRIQLLSRASIRTKKHSIESLFLVWKSISFKLWTNLRKLLDELCWITFKATSQEITNAFSWHFYTKINGQSANRIIFFICLNRNWFDRNHSRHQKRLLPNRRLRIMKLYRNNRFKPIEIVVRIV